MLIGVARSGKEPDIVRQNAMEFLRDLEPRTMDKVKIAVAADIHESLKGRPLQPVDVKVGAAIGIIPYLKQGRVAAFFADFEREMSRIRPNWESYSRHPDILNLIEDYGGLRVIPDEQLRSIMRWLLRCYLGEKGYGQYAARRPVFYSNTGAPIIERLVKAAASDKAREAFEEVASEKQIQTLIAFKSIAHRLERLRDLVEPI